MSDKNAVTLRLSSNPKVVFFHGSTFAYKDLIKAIPGAEFVKKNKAWQIPLESVPDALRVFPSLYVDNAVREAHAQLQQRHDYALAVKNADFRRVIPQNIVGLKGTLRNYQQVGVDFLHALADGEGDVLAFDMGLGKSLTSLAYYLSMLNNRVLDYALIVCPSPLKYATWAKEIMKFTDLPYTVVDGDTSQIVEWDDGKKERLSGRALREVQYQQWKFGSRIIIMNYELFMHDYQHDTYVFDQHLTDYNHSIFMATMSEYNAYKGNQPDHKEGVKHAIKELLPAIVYNPKDWTIRKHRGNYSLFRKQTNASILPPIDGRWMVIMDEAHRIKNPTAVTTKNLIKHLTPAKRKVLGTGTPLENNIQELHTLVDFCRPGLLGNYFKFCERYIETDFFGRPLAPKPQMMEELRKRIAPIMIRKTKQEALPELPPIERVDYFVEMTATQKKLYDQVKEGILLDHKTGEFTYMDVIVQLTRLQQVLDSPALLRKVTGDDTLPEDSGKLNELAGIISDIDPNRNKFILFSQYSDMTDIIYRFVTEPDKNGKSILHPSEVGYVRGGMKPLQVETVRQGFQEGNIKCVIMTTAGNYGLDLYKASYAICYDNLFNPQKMEQFLSRGHRSGNTTGLTAITMTTRNSYEENKQRILEKKRELFRALVDEDDMAFAKLFTVDELLSMM